jgi:hypothetical protein
MYTIYIYNVYALYIVINTYSLISSEKSVIPVCVNFPRAYEYQ